MNRLLTLTILLTQFLFSSGQEITVKINETIDSLKQLQVDTLLIYKNYCVGCDFNEPCRFEPSMFLFWKQNGQTLLKKFSNCERIQEILVINDSPLDFYSKHKATINSEKIEPPTYYEITKRNKKMDTTVWTQHVDHSTFYDFQFILNGLYVELSIDAFDLETKSMSHNKMNVFYERNNATKTKELIFLTDAAVSQFNK